MFKKSDDYRQLNAFSSPTEYFKDSTKNYYLKNDSWHNQFRKQIVRRVDESVFSVLYTKGKGAPNASFRVLVGMMILKEGQGWSDEQLFITERKEHIFKRNLSKDEFAMIESILEETGYKVVYRCTKAELDARFQELGKLMCRFVKLFKGHHHGCHGTLKTVFQEQFSAGRDKVVLPRRE